MCLNIDILTAQHLVIAAEENLETCEDIVVEWAIEAGHIKNYSPSKQNITVKSTV